MKIEEYTEGDKPELLTLWWDSWHSSSGFDHPRPLEEWEVRFDSLQKSNLTYVAKVGDNIVGFVMYDSIGRELSQLFVSHKLKRKGIGRALFLVAKSAMLHGFTLKVLENSSESRAFYESFGMIQRERILNPFNGKYEIQYQLEASK